MKTEQRTWTAATGWSSPQTSLGQSAQLVQAANAMKGDQERFWAAVMDDYMSQPLEPELVAQTIQHWRAPKNRTGALPQ